MRAIALVILFVVASPTLAQEGMYVGAGFGAFDYSEKPALLAPEGYSDSVSAWKVYGGFEFTDHVGIEVRYGAANGIMQNASGIDPDLGSIAVTVDQDLTISSVLALGMFSRDWGTVFGGVGYYNLSADADLRLETECCGGLSAQGSFDDNGLAAVMGVEWRFGRFGTGIGLRLEYEWLDLDNADASTFGIGVAYRF